MGCAAHLESAKDGRHSFLQVVPSLVGLVRHLPQTTGRVRTVFSGQAAVLLVDQLQLRQTFLNLSLEGLQKQNKACFSKETHQDDVLFICI